MSENKGDIISRAALLEELKKTIGCSINCNGCPVEDCYDSFLIRNAPAVDAQPVVKGHKVIKNRPLSADVVYVKEMPDGTLMADYYGNGKRLVLRPIIENNPVEYCSECGNKLDDTFQNFCPNCGAKMDAADTKTRSEADDREYSGLLEED